MYSYHASELRPGAPRVLPLPLFVQASYVTPVGAFPNDIGEFLEKHSVGPNDPRGMWVCRIWDLTAGDDPIAMVAYSWRDDGVVRDAIHVEDVHLALDLPGYLDMIGHGLFGQPYGNPSLGSV